MKWKLYQIFEVGMLKCSSTKAARDKRYWFFLFSPLSVDGSLLLLFFLSGSVLIDTMFVHSEKKVHKSLNSPLIWYSINFSSFSLYFFFSFTVILVSIRSRRSSDSTVNIVIIRQSYLAILSDICGFTKRTEGEFINAISATTLAITL